MRKRMRCQFIEEEASEGESSGEEVVHKEIDNKEAEKYIQEMMERRAKEKLRLQNRLEELMRNDIIDQVSSPSTDENDISNESINNEGPKLNDPKIWRFKCGRARVELELLEYIIAALPIGSKLVSIFYNPNLKGFVFFESYFEDEVRKVMRNVMYGYPIYVEPDQCFSLLEVQKSINVSQGQWVRFRNHKNYGTDLARVMKINRITNIITAKVIKRNKKGEKEPISWKRNTINGEIDYREQKESEFIYSDTEKEYKCAKIDGFALIKCNIKNIEPNITINDEELQMFFPDVIDRKILVQQAKRELMRRVDVQFKEGQYVRLIGEDDMNQGPKFKIMKIFDDNMIELMCKRDNREYTYLVHASEVRLAFKLYQEVKVVDGPHKGDVGVIISIKQGYVVLSTEYGSFKVPHSVLQFGHKNYQTQNELVKFGNGDFQIGCVVETKLQSVVVLTIHNQLEEIQLSKTEVLSFNKVEMNSSGESFKTNDNVRILEGKYADKFGLVKHCINGQLYIFNHLFPHSIILESIENCSVLVSQVDHVRQHDLKKQLGSICTIKLGQWSGYRGQIIGVKYNQFIVQLSVNNQKLVIQESHITLL